jgi:hypothetical protein
LLQAAGLVLTDLAIQGWHIRVRQQQVWVAPPSQLEGDRSAEKARIRRQELVKRDAQLRQPSVQTFIRSMERAREFKGRFTSIFSLMRDGRELAAGLAEARAHLNNGWADALARLIDPYLEFVSEEARCPHTGLRLMDVWRYFRHTWSNQYTSVPGRSMMFLVRDRAAPMHPVIGIGAISSPIMQIRERDTWIGWHPDVFVAEITKTPTLEAAEWLMNTVDAAIAEIFVEDFLESGICTASDLTQPGVVAIEKLIADSIEQRSLHHRYARARDHKIANPDTNDPGYWAARARTHLFRSKRGLALATYLRARMVLRRVFGNEPNAAKLLELASSREGVDVIRKVLRKAKADHIGIAVADLTVCGAIQPYNALLGGKLVSMMAASPEVVLEYQRRYSNYASEIASSVAGRPIVRSAQLVLLGTTSLYGIGSSQYNRIRIPCDRIGGKAIESINFAELGRSEAFGTSQYSDETVQALTEIVQQSSGNRVNSIFGEGISPKLRKVRQGLEVLGLPSDALLRHHRRRVVYGISLVRNLQAYLVGLADSPSYLVEPAEGAKATAGIGEWWRERWLRNRIAADEVLASVARHTLVRPITHGARVAVLSEDRQLSLM